MAEKNPFFGATFAERKAARLKAEKQDDKKQVDDSSEQVENKAIAPKSTRKKASKKS